MINISIRVLIETDIFGWRRDLQFVAESTGRRLPQNISVQHHKRRSVYERRGVKDES